MTHGLEHAPRSCTTVTIDLDRDALSPGCSASQITGWVHSSMFSEPSRSPQLSWHRSPDWGPLTPHPPAQASCPQACFPLPGRPQALSPGVGGWGEGAPRIHPAGYYVPSPQLQASGGGARTPSPHLRWPRGFSRLSLASEPRET